MCITRLNQIKVLQECFICITNQIAVKTPKANTIQLFIYIETKELELYTETDFETLNLVSHLHCAQY